MREFMTKKVGIVFAGVLATLFAAGAAFAYWTAGGSGEVPLDGTTRRSTTSDQTVSSNGAGVPPRPEGRSNTNDGPVYVTHVTPASRVSPGRDARDCDVATTRYCS
jgi:hypothetical protein